MPDEIKAMPITGPEAQQGQQIPMDASNLITVYTNFCRVTGIPEDLILDFGLNSQMMPTPADPIKLTHRVVMNYYTAKRLLTALQWAVTRFENQFGPLETDFQKRLRTAPPPLGPHLGAGGIIQ